MFQSELESVIEIKTALETYRLQTINTMTPIAEKGFSLLETLITIVILTVISVIAIPSFVTGLKTWEAKEVRSHLTNTFRVSRAQSFMHRQNTLMCLTDDAYLCHKNASRYLLVFSDRDSNNQFDPAIDNLVLNQPLNLDYGRLYLRFGNRHYIKFFGDTGLPRGHFGHIKYCPYDLNSANTYQISLNPQGNHRFKPYSFVKTGCP